MRKFPIFLQKVSDFANMAVNDGTIYEFDDFRLFPEDNLLLRNGESIRLTPKAFSTLVLLVERHGHLVRKSELMEKIWADTFVEEAALSRCVWTIRNALGEDSKSQRFIQTVPKSGYKFVADVAERRDHIPSKPDIKADANRPVSEASRAVKVTTSGVSPTPAAEAAGRALSLSGWKRYAVTSAVLAVVFAGVFYLSFAGPSTLAGTGNRIAVLPLKPIDAANRSDVYEIGVADSLINRLNSINGLVVRPLSATRKYDALDQDPLAAGREQKVDYVIASNYQLVDGKFRITSQLMDVVSGGIQETYKIETAAGDIFTLQDSVADEVAKKLIARFDRTAVGQLAKRGTDNEEAYRLYLQGRNLAMRRNPIESRKAVEYLEQAIRLDPNFALAYTQLARVSRKTHPVRELVDKALVLDPNLADAYVARAETTLFEDWDFTAAEKDLNKALELEPNNDQAHWLSSMLSLNRGHFDEALSKIEVARVLDPAAVMYMYHRGRILYYARRFDEAIMQYQHAMDVDDRFMHPYGWMARLYEVKGDHAAAFQFFIKGEERSPRKDKVDIYRQIYEAKGWMGVRGAVDELQPRDLIWFDLARVHALRGEKDAAFADLDKAIENREWLMTTLHVEPAFDGLRGDPRFVALLDRLAFERR